MVQFHRPLALAAILAALPAWAAAGPDFDSTFAAHLAAIQAKDLPAIEATLTRGEELHLILPNGTHTSSRQAFIDFHKTFFASKTWSMTFTPVSRTVSQDLAVVMVRSQYRDVDEGKPVWSENWLTFTFAREPQGWGLIHDQNTRIRTGEGEPPAS